MSAGGPTHPVSSAVIHVFIGTKAQYIKTAPVLRLMDARGVDYRLIDSGQHALLAVSFQEEMGIRPPDVRLGACRLLGSVGWLCWCVGVVVLGVVGAGWVSLGWVDGGGRVLWGRPPVFLGSRRGWWPIRWWCG